MENPPIYIATESGQRLSAPVLRPLFQTILPALQNKADKISIKTAKSGISAVYVCNSKTVPLKLHAEFHPFVTTSRIRIVSGMSIVSTKLQTGRMQIVFEKQQASVLVRITKTDRQETLSMKLTWD